MHVNALDQMLEEYQGGQTDVSITLRDGTVVSGKVKDFDGYVVLLTGGPEQMLYRHSILKLSKAGVVERERPAPRTRPTPAPRKPQPRPRPERERQPAKAPAAKAEGFGTLGDAMQKWLESQKSGE